MAEYTFKKDKDKYILDNTDIVDINYELKKQCGCSLVEYKTHTTGTVLAGEECIIILPFDGNYQLIIDGADIYPISYFYNLQLSIIEGVLNNLCDCCPGCSDFSKCTELMILQSKIDVYSKIIGSTMNLYTRIVAEQMMCILSGSIIQNVNEEIILGDSKYNEKFTKQLIAIDFLALYFYEYDLAETDEDKDYIDTKFQKCTIFPCIERLGIDIVGITTIMQNTLNRTEILQAVVSGVINGITTLFTLPETYIPETTQVYLNGLRQDRGGDYTEVAPNQIVFTIAPFTGDIITVDYYK